MRYLLRFPWNGALLRAAGWVLCLIFACHLPAHAGVTLISTTTSDNVGPRINSHGWVVWQGNPGNPNTNTVFLWNGSSIQQLFASYTELGPQINNAGQVAFPSRATLAPLGLADVDTEVFLWSGSPVQQLSNDYQQYSDEDPKINNLGQVAWVHRNSSGSNILLGNGSSVQALTTPATDAGGGAGNRNPQINDSGQVVWEHWDGVYWQVWLWNGSAAQPFTSSAQDHLNPQINNAGQVVWQGSGPSSWQIYLWNGSSVRQLSSNGNVNRAPQINNNGQVAWTGVTSSGNELFFWNGSSVRQLTFTGLGGNGVGGTDVSLNDAGQIAWDRHSSNYSSDVYLWDGVTAQLIATSGTWKDLPQINSAGQVVWLGWNGSDYKVYLYMPTAPAAPTTLSASAVSSTQVRLSWTDNSDNETAFAIWRSSGGGAFARVGLAVPNTTSYTDTGLTANTAYTYEVRATNNVGASTWSNQVTISPTSGPPAAPTSLAAHVLTSSQVSLGWTDNSNNETAFAVWRSTNGGSFARVAVLVPNTASYADTGLTPGASYTYEVRATNDAGASGWSNQVAVALVAPAAPTGLSAVAASATQVNLRWTDNSSNETAFAVWRSDNGGAFARIAVLVPNTTSFADTGLTAGAACTYEVRAINNVGASGWSNQVTVAMVSPAAPSGLSASAASATQANLHWTDNSNNETAFALWRSTNGGSFTRVAVVVPNTTSFTDTGLSPNTAYTYEVRATNNVGASAWSNPVSVTTPP